MFEVKFIKKLFNSYLHIAFYDDLCDQLIILFFIQYFFDDNMKDVRADISSVFLKMFFLRLFFLFLIIFMRVATLFFHLLDFHNNLINISFFQLFKLWLVVFTIIFRCLALNFIMSIFHNWILNLWRKNKSWILRIGNK